ncbi:hypothetical protein GEMRC1_007678 [Eukaryota sp. GEM-RC1]
MILPPTGSRSHNPFPSPSPKFFSSIQPTSDEQSLRARLNEVQEELINLRKRHSADVTYARARVREFQSALSERDSIIEHLHSDMAKLRATVDNANKQDREFSSLNNKYSALLHEKHTLSQEVDSLRHQLRRLPDLTEKLHDTTTAAESLTKANGELESMVVEQSEVIENFQRRIEELEMCLRNSEENDVYKENLYECFKVIASLLVSNQSLANHKGIMTKLFNRQSTVFNQISELSSVFSNSPELQNLFHSKIPMI